MLSSKKKRSLSPTHHPWLKRANALLTDLLSANLVYIAHSVVERWLAFARGRQFESRWSQGILLFFVTR